MESLLHIILVWSVVCSCTSVTVIRAACCFPDQWTADLVETIGEYNRDLDAASLAYGNREFFFDYTGKQIAYKEDRDNRTMKIKSHTWTILKYKEGMKYVIQSKTQCTKEAMGTTMESPCFPDDATFFGSHTYPGGLMVDVWFIQDKLFGGTRRFTVTKDDCLPISESRLTSGPDYILKNSLFQNVTRGITDPSVFDVPSICNSELTPDDTLYFKIG